MKKLNARRISVIIFLIIFTISMYINIRGSYLEYKELGEGFISIFTTNLKYEYSVMIANFFFLYVILYSTGIGIKKGLKIFFDEEKKQMPKLPNKSISLVVSLIISVLTAKFFTENIILYASNVSFNITDKLFNLDIAFYMFTEPLIKMLIIYFGAILIGTTFYSIIYYIIVLNKYFDGIDKDTFKKSWLTSKIFYNLKVLSIIIALYTLISSMDIVLSTFLKTDSGEKIIGAGFIDSTIKLWGYIVFSMLIIVATFRAINSAKKGDRKKVLKNLIIIPSYLIILFLIIFVFDMIFVRPNKFDKEKEYIATNIESTKKAYGIDIESQNIEYSGTVNSEDIENNKNIIDNVVIVNKDTILNNLNYSQTGAGYYKYNTAGIAKYDIDGKSELVYVSPREIVNSKRAYNSKTYEYTHGYGLIFTSATSYSQEGGIKYVQNDTNKKEQYIKINTPQIYYGLETNNNVITNGKNISEYDYTLDGKEYESSYNGNSGLKLNFMDRLALGIKTGDLNLAFSGNITEESKVLVNRNIIKRAKLALPNVIYDDSPYTVVDSNGDIYWVLDVYTTSDRYPYSSYSSIVYDNKKMEINYIRNSIKVIINSYNGNMKFYITDRTDPIAMAYRNTYKELFQDLDEKIPEDISSKFVYPKLLYDIQAAKLEEYHNTKPDVLYRSDNTWQRATYTTSTSTTNKSSKTTLDSYYTFVNEGTEKIGLVQMYMPKDKQIISSYLIGTVKDGENVLNLKTFSGDNNILSPTELDIQISQNEEIQTEIDNLSATGVKVTKNMIIVPIQNTILYIEPIFQTAINESKLPILRKVVVASGNKVAIGNNLEEAIQKILVQSEANIETIVSDDIEGIMKLIVKANNNLTLSLDSNNWEMMGTDIKKLQELIKQMEEKMEGNQSNTRIEDKTDSIEDKEDTNENTLADRIKKLIDKDNKNQSEKQEDLED